MLSYSTTGDPANAAILFLHGFMGSREDWAMPISVLSDEYFCIGVDLPGHGESLRLPLERMYTFDASADLLCKVLDDAGVESCHVVGYSMGGRVGLHLAMKKMPRVRSLTMEAASPGLRTTEECVERSHIDDGRAVQLREGHFEEFLRTWYTAPMFGPLVRQEKLYEQLLVERLKNDPAELARTVSGFSPGRQPSYWMRLGELKTPTLFVTGAKDERYSVRALEMANLCPYAENAIVADAGHNVHIEQPGKFADAVRTFIREVDDAAG